MAILFTEKSFEVIFKEHYHELCRSVYRIVPDEQLAEDLVQDVFCGLWNKQSSLEVEGSLRSYLFKACINAALSHLRRQKNVAGREALFAGEAETEVNYTEEQLIFNETSSRINAAIDALPPACRSIFMLSRFENLSYKDIATQLNISLSTVENQMVKALRVLRKQILIGILIKIFFH